MPLDYDKIMSSEMPEIVHSYTKKDTMLYALGLGFGADPVDRDQLAFVYEKDLRVLPTMASVLAHPGPLGDPAFRITRHLVVHGEQRIVVHRPIPPEGTVLGRSRVRDVIDKGEDKGALIYSEREIIDEISGETLATVQSTTFARGDGGFGGKSGPTPPVHPIPESSPQATCDIATLPQAALVYRLSGDYNPLHSDPDIAAAAGFDRPILHGLCTYGVAGHAVLKTYCGYDPARLKSLEARFSRPLFPGETIRTEMWREGNVVSFRARVPERDVVVLDNGKAEIAE